MIRVRLEMASRPPLLAIKHVGEMTLKPLDGFWGIPMGHWATGKSHYG